MTTSQFKARFIPRNPGKYIGNCNAIFCRSAWEMRVMKLFDMTPGILKWASEEIKIPYLKPTTGRVHHYYPDFVIIYRDRDNNIQKEIVEVKPLKESMITPTSSVYDRIAFAVNQAKWTAASAYAEKLGMKFRVLTEVDLFNANPHLIQKRRRRPKKLAVRKP